MAQPVSEALEIDPKKLEEKGIFARPRFPPPNFAFCKILCIQKTSLSLVINFIPL